MTCVMIRPLKVGKRQNSYDILPEPPNKRAIVLPMGVSGKDVKAAMLKIQWYKENQKIIERKKKIDKIKSKMYDRCDYSNAKTIEVQRQEKTTKITIEIEVTDDERKMLSEIADDNKMRIDEYLREVLFDEIDYLAHDKYGEIQF